MKHFIVLFVITLGLSALSLVANAQSADAGAVSGSQSGATALQGNAQQLTVTNPAAPDNIRVRNNAGVVLGGFAAPFSPDGCSGTSQIGASIVGATIGAGTMTLEQNCAHIRRTYAWMAKADYALKTGRPDLEVKYLAMADLILCTTGDDNELQSCKELGLVGERTK
jgi:hypothetical protein